LGILEQKKGLILGIANDKSIAWGIAQFARREGAALGLNYFGETMQKRVRPLAASVEAELIEPLDVGDDTQIEEFFQKVKARWGTFDFLVHSIAFASRDSLRGRFLQTSRADFQLALDISCYSFLAVAQRAVPIMNPGGSLLTISYLGAVRAVPNYNVMGVAKAALEATTRYLAADLGQDQIRVNAISAGPIRTLAASGIGNFRKFLDTYAKSAALRRNITQEEVGKSAVYFLSDLSSGVTGEVHYVDAGFSIGVGDLGMPEDDAPAAG
jgi:enoyl-[acyl-carrier protein] reductase I